MGAGRQVGTGGVWLLAEAGRRQHVVLVLVIRGAGWLGRIKACLLASSSILGCGDAASHPASASSAMIQCQGSAR